MSSVECPACGTRYRVDTGKVGPQGGRFRCKRCDAVVTVEGEVGGARKRRIVVADDTAFFRALLADMLTEAGYEVITAENGEEALQVIKHELPHIDLVLLDMLMPKMDGFEVIKELKKGVMGKDLAILALSGIFKSESDISLMKELGIRGYIDKETSPEQILERVRMILEEAP